MRQTIGPYPFTPTQRRALHHAGITPRQTPQKFTITEYVQMAETGILTSDDQTELIDGMVMQMSPIGRPHSYRLSHIFRTLARLLPDNLEISPHSTIRLPNQTAPQPDLTLLTPQASQDRQNIPGPADLLLIVEIAAPSPHPDRQTKPQRYAQSNIPELWIFPLESQEIEVHRHPTPTGYAHTQTYRPNQTLTIQALPQIQLTTNQLLA